MLNFISNCRLEPTGLNTWNPLTSDPLDYVPRSVCYGKNLLFSSLCKCRMISVHLQDLRSCLMDCVSVRDRTGPVGIAPGLYPVVYRFKLFQIETINRE